MVHEALGHGTAAWLTGDPILSISTVALQNERANRFVSAAGTLANCGVGACALLLFRRARKLTPVAYFLWLLGAFNLLNCGYLVVSAILNNGDWANVIAGLAPPRLWRCLLALTGATLYVAFVRWISSALVRMLGSEASAQDSWCLVLPAYLAGGAVMTLASVFNPISPSLILLSGAGASFGLNAGLLFIPAIVERREGGEPAIGATGTLPFSLLWVVLGLVSGGVFIAVLGPGIQFAH